MVVDRDNTGDVIPTETLARLYEKQGFLDKAVAVYRKLVALEPGRKDWEEQLRDVERRLEGRRTPPRKSEARTIFSRLSRWHGAIGRRRKILDQWRGKRKKILVIYGSIPELDAGQEPSFSDHSILKPIRRKIESVAQACGMTAETFQSNREEDLIRKIRSAPGNYDVLIINPTQCTETNVTIRDALSTLDCPVIEVYPSNSCGQEPSSQKSLISDLATAHLAGFGQEGYVMAVRAAASMTDQA